MTTICDTVLQTQPKLEQGQHSSLGLDPAAYLGLIDITSKQCFVKRLFSFTVT